MRKTISVLVVVFGVIAVLAGCSKKEKDDGIINIAQSMPTLNNPWYVLFANGSKNMAAELGARINQVTNPESNAWDPGTQIGRIENLIATKPDVLSVDPTSTDGINTAINEAMGKGIPVIMSGSKVSTKVVASITADNKQGGRLCGEYLAKRLGGKGKVAIILGTPGRDVIQNRENGCKQILANYPDIKIVAEQVANLERVQAVSVTETILQANPDIDAIWAANDEMALGAVEALRSVGKVGTVIVGGFDASPDAVDAIKNGEMHFTANQIPYEIGVRAIAVAVMVAKKKAPPSEDIELAMSIVSTENVQEYLEQQEKLQKETIQKVKAEYGL